MLHENVLTCKRCNVQAKIEKMQDVLFDIEGNLEGEGESTRTHQRDILLIHKGWNKFYPHIGVGIMDHIGDDGDSESIKSSITYEYERDGMQVNDIVLDTTGQLIVDASYN